MVEYGAFVLGLIHVSYTEWYCAELIIYVVLN
jgi:hypothetical protein